MTVGGLVLAGGEGRRLGRPKAAVRVGAVSLVERAVAAVRSAGCSDVVVVTRSGVELPPLDATVIVDDPGPPAALRAVRTGLAALAADEVVVLACDLPLAGPLVARLVAAPPGGARVAVDGDGRVQPLCGRYPRGAALAAADERLAAGDARVTAWAVALDPDREAAQGDELLNVNDDADRARAEAVLSERPE